MTTHQCSNSLVCNSITCTHASPHSPDHPHNCDRPAPCGCWPGRPDLQPHVVCIPVDQVQPLKDCPDCGKKESMGHHHRDCINELKRQLKTKEVQP